MQDHGISIAGPATILFQGGSSLDAVEAATRKMEDSGVLNAGCGAYLTEEGTVELDAMIMDGQTLNTGKFKYFYHFSSIQMGFHNASYN